MRLGISSTDVREIQRHASSRFVSLENVLQQGAREGGGVRWDPADHDDRSDPAIAAEREAALLQLNEAMLMLSKRDQAILRYRYGESKPFHEVGRLLGLSESRVCQLHKRILSVLRRELAEALEEAA